MVRHDTSIGPLTWSRPWTKILDQKVFNTESGGPRPEILRFLNGPGPVRGHDTSNVPMDRVLTSMTTAELNYGSESDA